MGRRTVAKRADRSVLGSMNDMGLVCGIAVADAGNLVLMDVVSLNDRLHRNINSARNHDRPIVLVISRTAE